MRDSIDIKLEQVILHHIESRDTAGIILSELCINLDTSEGLKMVSDYFIRHIQNSLKDPTAKAAKFKTDTFKDGDVAQICCELVHDRLDFVIGSQKIAQSLLEPRHEDYDMMLLDRQTEQEPAQFFTKDFLKADLALDDRERTKRYDTAMTAAINELRIIPEITSEQNDAVYSIFNGAIKQAKVDIDRIIDSLPLDDKYKQVVRDKFNKLPDREFSPDPEYVKTRRKKVRYKGDRGLYISVNREDLSQVIRSVKNPDDNSDFYEIVIRTKIWKEEK